MLKEKNGEKYGYGSQTTIILSSSQAGISATILTSPLWVVKTRLLLNTDKDENVKNQIK